MEAPLEIIPAFWSEPWRWAAPAWRREYGAPGGEVDRCAARLVYSGWASRFCLPRQWSAPADARWITLVQAPCAALHAAIAMLGQIALLRGGVPAPVCNRGPTDRWLAHALKYREMNSMRIGPLALDGPAPSPRQCGISVLCAMAKRDWSDAESRFAMLAAPDSDGPAGASKPKYALEIDSIDVSRCLSLCGAVLRGLYSDESARAGGQ
jgi:hypothetical protein